MGLLTPWLLALGLAAAVPLLLHLMHRRPGPRVEFPALRYLRRAQRERGRRVRLRQLALLALRVLAVLLLALAAARPFASRGAGAHAPTAVAIVLDNSMSTGVVEGDGLAFDRLRDAALATLAAAGPDDRFWLIGAATPWLAAASGDAADVRAALLDAAPTDASADLAASLARAAALLDAGAGRRAREIHLLTDLQRATLRGLRGAHVVDDVVAFVPPAPAANHAVAAVQVGGGFAPRAGEPGSLVALAAGPAGDTVTLRLWLDDRPVGAAIAAAGAAASFALPARPAGWVTGRVETAPDALPADDRRSFAYRVGPPPAVAVAGAAPFVEQAVSVLEQAGRVRATAPAAADVVIGPDAAAFAGRARAVVVLPPGDPLLVQAANTRLAAAGVPWRYRALTESGTARFAATDDPELGATLRGIDVRRAYALEPTAPVAPADTLLRLSDGRPWAVRVRDRAGRPVLMLAGPLDGSASDVPASAAMVPLADRLLGGWAAADDGAASAFAPGTVLTLPGTATAIESPDGAVTDVEGGAPYRLPPRAGLYRVTSGDSTLEILAVAPDSAESDLARADDGALADALPDAHVRTASVLGAWRDAIYRSRRGGEWWRALLVLVLVGLVVESAVAAGRRSLEDD